jgi:hypothetical protein
LFFVLEKRGKTGQGALKSWIFETEMEEILGKRKSINPSPNILADSQPSSPLSMPMSPSSISSPGSDNEHDYDDDDLRSNSSSSSSRKPKKRKLSAPQWVEDLKGLLVV